MKMTATLFKELGFKYLKSQNAWAIEGFYYSSYTLKNEVLTLNRVVKDLIKFHIDEKRKLWLYNLKKAIGLEG